MASDLGKHLATYSLFREAGGSLYVTVQSAPGVKDELGQTNLPLHPMALRALYDGVRQMREREVEALWQDKPSQTLPDVMGDR